MNSCKIKVKLSNKTCYIKSVEPNYPNGIIGNEICSLPELTQKEEEAHIFESQREALKRLNDIISLNLPFGEINLVTHEVDDSVLNAEYTQLIVKKSNLGRHKSVFKSVLIRSCTNVDEFLKTASRGLYHVYVNDKSIKEIWVD